MKRAAFAIAAAILALAAPVGAGVMTVGSGVGVDFGTGHLDLGGADLNVAGTLSAGSGGFEAARDVSIEVGGVLNADSALIQICGDWSNSGTFNAGTSTVAFVDGCGVTSSTITGANTFASLSLTTAIGKQVNFAAGVTQAVTGGLTLGGTAGNLLVLRSTVGGSEAFLDLAAPPPVTTSTWRISMLLESP